MWSLSLLASALIDARGSTAQLTCRGPVKDPPADISVTEKRNVPLGPNHNADIVRHVCKADQMKLQPTPTQAMALLASGLLAVEESPDIAAQWLADGMDSENLRMLAAAGQEDPDDIRELWTATLKDLKIRAIPLEDRWPLIWAYELATWKAGERTKGQVLRDAVTYLQEVEYADREADEAYVLWNLWDELTSNYIPPRTDAEIWADVERYLHSFV